MSKPQQSLYKQVVIRLFEYKWWLIISIILMLMSTILASYIPVSIGWITDACNNRVNEITLFRLTIVLLLIIVFKEVLFCFQNICLMKLMIRFGKKLREDCFKSLLKREYQEVKNIKRGRVMQTLYEDIEEIKSFGINSFTKFFCELLLACIAFYKIGKVYLPLAIIGTIVYSIYLIPTVYFGKKQKSYTSKLREILIKIHSMFLERLETIRLVKTFGQEKKSLTDDCICNLLAWNKVVL